MIENPQLPSYNNAILDDYYNFMHPIGNELNQLDIEIVKKLENYAINLHRNFKSDFLGDVFWRDFGLYMNFVQRVDNISICNFFGKIFIAVIFIFEKIFRFVLQYAKRKFIGHFIKKHLFSVLNKMEWIFSSCYHDHNNRRCLVCHI